VKVELVQGRQDLKDGSNAHAMLDKERVLHHLLACDRVGEQVQVLPTPGDQGEVAHTRFEPTEKPGKRKGGREGKREGRKEGEVRHRDAPPPPRCL